MVHIWMKMPVLHALEEYLAQKINFIQEIQNETNENSNDKFMKQRNTLENKTTTQHYRIKMIVQIIYYTLIFQCMAIKRSEMQRFRMAVDISSTHYPNWGG